MSVLIGNRINSIDLFGEVIENMTVLNLLHISDLHWSGTSAVDRTIVAEALRKDLKKVEASLTEPITAVIFSGDMVQAGSEKDSFQQAYENFFVPLLEDIGLGNDRLFICPGNHDICRETVRSMPIIEKGYQEKLKDLDSINGFIDRAINESHEEILALKRTENFYKWHDKVFPHAKKFGYFSRIFRINHHGKRIGISALNSAWRATGESDDADNKKLIIGERVIDNSINELNGCDLKIAIQHHPYEIMVDADHQSVSPRVYNAFDIMCCGHTHNSNPLQLNSVFGTCIISQSGSIFSGRPWFNGYQVITIDTVSNDVEIKIREYYDTRREFDSANRIKESGLISFKGRAPEPTRDNMVELFLREKRSIIRNLAYDQLNFSDFNFPNGKILDTFSPPNLVKKSSSKMDDSGNIIENYDKIEISEIIMQESNVVFLGDRQSGKTSLRHYIGHQIASGNCPKPQIPVYIDAKTYTFNLYGINKAIGSLYGAYPSAFSLNDAIEGGYFVFLVDGLNDLSEKKLANFQQHIDAFSQNRWIFFGSPTSDSIDPERAVHKHFPNFDLIKIRELTRRSIRKLTSIWFDQPGDDAKKSFELVMGQIVRDGLPRTPYMVSLLLWAARKGKENERVNEAILLQNVIDHLLDRADFTQAKRGALPARGKELLLQMLATSLRKRGGYVTTQEFSLLLTEYFQKKRLSFNVTDVANKLVQSGLLRLEDDIVSFKYECFAEYFIASMYNDDVDLRQAALADLGFLNNKREFELLSGLQQDNSKLLQNIVSQLNERKPEKLDTIDRSMFQKIAQRNIDVSIERKKLMQIKKKRLTDDQIDAMMDELDERALKRGDKKVSESLDEAGGDIVVAAENRQRESIKADQDTNAAKLRPATYMAGLDLLSRIVRNSDFTDYEIKGPIVEKIFNDWSGIYLILIEELDDIVNMLTLEEDDKEREEVNGVVKATISKLLHNIVGSVLNDSLATPALADTLNSISDEGKFTDGDYLLYLYMLEDINDSEWTNKWGKVIGDKNSSTFSIDLLLERLWLAVSSKALDEDQSKRVTRVVDMIERRFDWDNHRKSTMLENIKGVATLKKLKEKD